MRGIKLASLIVCTSLATTFAQTPGAAPAAKTPTTRPAAAAAAACAALKAWNDVEASHADCSDSASERG